VEDVLVQASRRELVVSISTVNWGEMVYVIGRKMSDIDALHWVGRLDSVPVDVVPVDRLLANQAAIFKRRGGISYADCFAAALGYVRNAPVLTGDREFQKVAPEVDIEWLPQRSRA